MKLSEKVERVIELAESCKQASEQNQSPLGLDFGSLTTFDFQSSPEERALESYLRTLSPGEIYLITELLQTRPGVAWRAHRYGLFRFPELVERPR
jgi:hypothetical protein